MRRAIAAFIKGMYVYDKEMGIIYENIAAKSLGRDTRSGLYSLLGIEPQITGRAEYDDDDYHNDTIPLPRRSIDPWKALLIEGKIANFRNVYDFVFNEGLNNNNGGINDDDDQEHNDGGNQDDNNDGAGVVYNGGSIEDIE